MTHPSKRQKNFKIVIAFLAGILPVPERLRKEYIQHKQDVRITARKSGLSFDELLSSAAHAVTLWNVARKNGAQADKAFSYQAEALAYIAVYRELGLAGKSGTGNKALEVLAAAAA